jgi:hypothetical protein
MGGDRQPVWQQLVMTAVSVLAVAAMLWMEAPQWQRDQIRGVLRNRLAVAAWRSGRAAMRLELDRGRPVGLNLHLTEVLSRLRDAAGLP